MVLNLVGSRVEVLALFASDFDLMMDQRCIGEARFEFLLGNSMHYH